MDDSMDASAFELQDSSDFEPKPKTKAKAAPKKTATTAAVKPKAPKSTAAKTAKPAAKAAAKPKKRAKPDSDDENEPSDLDSDHDASLLSNTPPSAKKQKKAPAPKKASGKPLAEIENGSFVMNDSPQQKAKSTKGVTEQYKKLTQHEHILLRPDTYIGSVEFTTEQMWVYNSTTEAMENRKVNFVPGLYKIFDEILVNAADNKQRDKNMNELRVSVDAEKGEISVKNNGRGIPVEIHEKEKVYIPELIFGHLLSGSNYDDKEAKLTGGRNGYGAKLTNIYSTQFSIETVDSKTKQRYRQTWRDNMSVVEKAKIDKVKGDDYTQVTFSPDFAKFGMDKMDEDFEALVKRRVYDMAGTCTGVKVYLNGERIKISKFKQYMEMYTKAIQSETPETAEKNAESLIITDNPHERWEIGFSVSDGNFQQVSFVNSIATTQGGSHVNYIVDQICDKLEESVNKQNKGGVKLKKAQIRNHIFLFVNCLIVNPAFTSQTKEQLTTKPSAFGSKPQVSDKFLKAIAKSEAVNNIIHFAQRKADQVLAKSDGNRRQRMNNAKLTDANKAGTKDGWKCTLILTEGDSAAPLALAGRAVVDPDLFGVFPLRGKLLNVRDASIDQISKNQEIQNIKKFLGLQHKKEYTDVRSLRYGHLMIMTDQDHDGSHIKGLLINFLQCQFPSLLRIPEFLLEFITPIVKVWKGDPKRPSQERTFFTMPEYEAWRQLPGNHTWEHKYYKGLGTSSTADAHTYFTDLDKHLKQFHAMQEGEADLIDLAFSKKKADARKTWLQNFVPGTYLDMSGTELITYDDFINKELILFSMADNQRSIPSVIDGLKPGQRKVLYTCFRRNLKKDAKVVELAGLVSGSTAYAYGDTSLQQTIVGLAQNFVGSNNMNMLEPSGNFGSRLQGGNDAASARYIYTRLSPFARRTFHQTDEALLTYNTDDGNTIEPEVYYPVVPMILINGADGIGTGWSTSIPNYRPEDVIENLKRRMHGEGKDSMQPMQPWFRGWTGETEQIAEDRFRFAGKLQITGPNEIEISELPVRMWTQDFKERLEEILKAEKTPSCIKDYTEYNTPEKVRFIIKLDEKSMSEDVAKLEELFKLSKTMATSNLVAFDAQGRIHKYATVLDIMEEFYQNRLRMYIKRKAHMLAELERELLRLTNQARFVQMIIDNKLVVSKKKKSALVAELQKLGFTRFPKVVQAKKQGELEEVVENDGGNSGDDEADAGASDYDYLLGMAIWSLTQERVEKLLQQIGQKEEDIKILGRKSPTDLWTKDLDDLLEEWHTQLAEEAKLARQIRSKGRRASAKLGLGGKPVKKRKAAGGDDDWSDDDYGASKKSKTAAKSKGMAGLLSMGLSTEMQTAFPKVNAVEQKPVVKPLADRLPKAAEIVEASEIMTTVAKSAGLSKEKAAPAKKVTTAAKKPIKIDSDNDDSDAFLAIAKETSNRPARAGRAAAQKTKKYNLDSDDDMSSDDGHDLLPDVSSMVKGISSSSAQDGATRLFHPASGSQKTSAHGARPKAKKLIAGTNISDDETDWAALEQNSPQKASNRTMLSEEDDSMAIDDAPVVRAPTAKAAVKAKPSAAAISKTTKPATALKPKKAPAPVAPVVPKPLSPAAKAYANKKANLTAAASASSKPGTLKSLLGKKTLPPSSDDDASQADADEKLANDILSDDEDDIASPAVARPSRRAAASKVKSKYVFDEDDDDDDDGEENAEDETGFDDDESD